ncbi:MAG: hypothetical protein V7606_3612 [Burkholderiales bacterium]|jgi:hypothetical protein
MFHRFSVPNRLRFKSTIAVAALLAAGAAFAEPMCSRDVPVNKECEISLDALHPMQPAVGMIQVEERAAKLRGETDFSEQTSRALPVVQAPDGGFYLTDGHHQASVLHRAGAKQVKARVIGRFNNQATFWDEMRARRWVYLFDQHGRPITPAALPERIADLADDPYRSLAGYAQNAGYFGKTNTYFMEFEWARYFGSRMGWQPIDRMTLLSALQSAEKLACKPEAKDLPGYLGPCATGR